MHAVKRRELRCAACSPPIAILYGGGGWRYSGRQFPAPSWPRDTADKEPAPMPAPGSTASIAMTPHRMGEDIPLERVKTVRANLNPTTVIVSRRD